MQVLRQAALLCKAEFHMADVNQTQNIRYGVAKQYFTYEQYKKLAITMTGQVQIENAVAAVEIITTLGRLGFPVKEEQLRQGCFGGERSGIPEIRTSVLGNQAGMIGAASLI